MVGSTVWIGSEYGFVILLDENASESHTQNSTRGVENSGEGKTYTIKPLPNHSFSQVLCVNGRKSQEKNKGGGKLRGGQNVP